MNPRQRLIAAIEGRPVDRMPVMTYNFHPFSDRWQRQPDGTYAGIPEYQPMMDAVWRAGTGMLCKVSAQFSGEIQERSRARDLWETAKELLAELEGEI